MRGHYISRLVFLALDAATFSSDDNGPLFKNIRFIVVVSAGFAKQEFILLTRRGPLQAFHRFFWANLCVHQCPKRSIENVIDVAYILKKDTMFVTVHLPPREVISHIRQIWVHNYSRIKRWKRWLQILLEI